jgi:hypothetical protein
MLQGVANGENGARENWTSADQDCKNIGFYPGSPPKGKDPRPVFACIDYDEVYNGGDLKRWA